ncbi:type IX secretion system PorP/SprF family membrane protein [Neolewinella xylanilytica]|uniref:Type IX secretion system PorP/SprF family membrane protein n=1 Tax=Neolewinella xylanilytica TaxID=1514080 RepID=A0A2S6I9R3_9BACT|nr:PorP/SprF family type IX secretion system membrane protein [Neolewinella xylanilytica]PPK88236.1 type IX secretion system PorP/SprF family membrane protein [Neolewinella xylanilytica]
MTRQFYLLLLLLLVGGAASAQQLGHYSLYWLDPVQFNPAYAGLDNSLSITGTFRAQWTGLDGQPTSQRLSAHLPVYFLSSGFGVEAERDELGARSLNRFGATWSYQLVTSSAVWSVGVSGRYYQMSLDGSALRTPDGDYTEPNFVAHNDVLLPSGNEGAGTMTFAAGLYYQSERLEGGLSVRNLTESVIEFPGLDYRLGRQYHAYLRARFDFLRAWELSPLIGAMSDGIQHQVTTGLIARYDENIFGGIAYRGYNNQTTDAILLMAGLNLSDKVSLAYAYDLTLSELRTVQDGSHELTLKYNLRQRIGAGVPPPIIFNPRTKQ